MSEHSEKYELVKGYYDSGEWKKKAVKNAVRRTLISEEEYARPRARSRDRSRKRNTS